MNHRFSCDFDANKKLLKTAFGMSPDFYMKDISIEGYQCCICMIECLAGMQDLWTLMLEHLSRIPVHPETPDELFHYILHGSVLPVSSVPAECIEDAFRQLTAGCSIMLVNGVPQVLVISTQKYQFRSVQEPSGEGNIRGSRAGFTEPLRINISLIRGLIRTSELTIETMVIGEKTQTEIALLYHAGLVPRQLLKSVRQKLQSAEIPFLFDSGYLAPFLQKGQFSFFQSVGYTERPDTASAKICEGKIVILVNGSPFAMILPYFFAENFQSSDDYSEKAYFASMIRIFKYAAFLIAVLLPGLFVAAAEYTPEIFPPQLMYKIAAADLATPLPLFGEVLFVIFLLEIIREAGLRLPKPIGHSVSLVAALIIGDAAIGAGLIGTPVVIAAALTTICSFVVPALYEPVTILRILFVLAGGIFGPVGIELLAFTILQGMCRMESFGMSYIAPAVNAEHTLFRDGIFRRNWRVLAAAPFSINDYVQQKEDGMHESRK